MVYVKSWAVQREVEADVFRILPSESTWYTLTALKVAAMEIDISISMIDRWIFKLLNLIQLSKRKSKEEKRYYQSLFQMHSGLPIYWNPSTTYSLHSCYLFRKKQQFEYSELLLTAPKLRIRGNLIEREEWSIATSYGKTG